MSDSQEQSLRALLVTIALPGIPDHQSTSHLEELTRLVDTMGISDTEGIMVSLKQPQPQFYVGTGKAQEICDLAASLEVDLIIFDDDLSPNQQRNWEELSGLTVIDRQEVILEIFAQRAHTKEAVLQVGLARMQYSLPRLTRSYTHLSRQRGGAFGNKGSGETQLELDRRIILRKIDQFEEELEKVKHHREVNRKKRRETGIPTVSVVGYTNAGKSSLMNALTRAGVFAEDKLFATLDPTTRKLSLPGGREILLTDTVGFIQKLPHTLVNAFRSTLEETLMADVLIHLVDVSDPDWAAQLETTDSVVADLETQDIPKILVFNKVDLLNRENLADQTLLTTYPDALYISVKTGQGLTELLTAIESILAEKQPTCTFLFPFERGDLPALVHRHGKVISENYGEKGVEICAVLDQRWMPPLSEFRV